MSGNESNGAESAPSNGSTNWIAIGAAFLAVVTAIGFYGGLAYLVYHYWSTIIRFIAAAYGRVALVIIAVLAGIALYILRVEQRLHYGIIEITFGVISLFASIMNAVNVQTSTLQVAAGVYIIVRGLDDIKIGLDERPSHRLWAAWNSIYYSEAANKLRAIVGAGGQLQSKAHTNSPSGEPR